MFINRCPMSIKLPTKLAQDLLAIVKAGGKKEFWNVCFCQHHQRYRPGTVALSRDQEVLEVH